jgi:hypothetical protein
MARRRRKRNDNSGWRIASWILGSFMVVAIIGGIIFIASNRPIALNPITGCPIDSSLIAKNISIIFDTTERLIPSQREEVKNRIGREMETLKENTKVTFYRVESNQSSGIQQVTFTPQNTQLEINEFCRGPSPWGASPNQEALARQLPGLFGDAFIGIVGNSPQSFSPLIDALRYVAATLTNNSPENKVIVISDLIENSQVLTMYDRNWLNLYNDNKNQVLRQRPIYPSNTDIEVYLLNRPQYSIQDQEFLEFWFEVLAGDGTVNIDFKNISGGLGGV